jgi:filamentous hemagglutinin
VEGGSFGRAFEGSVIGDLGAVGASAIGAKAGDENSWLAEKTPGNVLAHAALGCALSAADGTGCAGGAIGAGASAIVAPYLVQQAGGLGNLTDGQRSAIVGVSTLLGGLASGVAGQNAVAGANAATNESLNNSTNPEDIVHGRDLIPLEGGGGGGAGIGGPGRGAEIFPDAPSASVGAGAADAEPGAAPVTTAQAAPAPTTTGDMPVDAGTGANDWSDAPATNSNGAAGSSKPDFYVTSDGTAVPATGYRGFGGDRNLAEATSGVIAPRNPTYFTFNNITGMTGQEVQDLLQLPQVPTHGVSFDTLQLIPDLSIPGGRWNTLPTPEPFTSTYPEWGTGGGTQAITSKPISVSKPFPLGGKK